MKDYRMPLAAFTALCAGYNAANGIWWLAALCAIGAAGQLYYMSKGE